MVLSRNDKRKRKEGDLVDLMEPLSEASKRTKVHAQRKFAQGATTVFNPTHTPIKDKEKSKPPVITELITHKRPNTEDFLTFLCFRGTSILPPSLNFFNVGTKKEKAESKQGSAAVPSKSQTSNSQSASNQKPEPNQKTVTKVKQIVAEKKKVSSVIQKKITKFKSTTSTVQALKKKYQEQRLAKQRIKNKFKSSTVMRTRSCTERAILKVGGQLAPRKFLPRMENKRLGLRSGVLRDATKKASPKSKVLPPKPKKKVVKQDCSDSSESDLSTSSEEEEDELPSEKSNANVKRMVQKQVQKNMCTRSKSDMRRITRSHSVTVASENSSKRPTRKTKEAAAAYMEILGRKLLSPATENDDNASTESYSESPTTRRSGNGETETKSKMKQTVKTVTKTRSCKATSLTDTTSKRLDKSKNNKMVFKSKRLVKVQKYCEIESDEESESSAETNNTRPVTRRSVGKVTKPVVRHLRSASKNSITRVETQNTISIKGKTQIQTSVKTTKEKFVLKRKREVGDKSASGKSSEIKQKEAQSNVNKESESDEETLGMLLNKLKRKKDIEEEEEKVDITEASNTKEKQKQVSKERAVKLEVTKVSDDEESFHGFTKKTITNIVTTSQTCTTPASQVTDVANIKADKTKTVDPVQVSIVKQEPESKTEVPEPPQAIADPEKNKSLKNCKPVNVPVETIHETSPRLSEERKHAQKISVSNTNIVDVTLSTLHMRKEKVNMSTEQIEKWLNESTFAKEESKIEMENMSNFKYDICEKKADTSHLSISSKIHHLVRPVNVTLSKLSEKSSLKDRTSLQNKSIAINVIDTIPLFIKKQECTPTKQIRIVSDIKESAKGKPVKSNKDSSPGEEDTLSKSDQNSLDGSVEKKLAAEKKSIFQPRKPFLPKVKERKTVVPNVNAFSPENESSVYAFESDTEVPVSTPFRRKIREQNKIAALNAASENELSIVEEQVSKENSETSETKVKVPKIVVEKIASDAQESKSTSVGRSKFELPKSFGTLANIQVLPLDKLTTSWSNVNCSASIAVQVNLDDSNQEQSQIDDTTTGQQKSTEISTQTENSNENDDENDGQLFYIPLQAVTRGGPNLVQGQQLIQGVAVKLGTDGPNGPNQKVLLRAKLVTKPPSSIARCPPVGTVQPTTRPPPTSNVLTGITEHSTPSTSAIAPPTIAVASTEPVTASSLTTETTAQPALLPAPQPPIAVLVEKLTKSPKASRERKMSIDSTKNVKRCPAKSKQKHMEFCSPTNNVAFPSAKGPKEGARMVEAPTFHPTEKDFQDPLDYIDKIRPVAEKFGICRVVPPSNFKPECKVSDDMRFTAYNQYVHRMLHRWGPNVMEMMAIKKYLATQSITLSHPPWIGGMEVDLPHLYQTVQSLGGLKEVIEKKKWQKVADGMKIPKSAQDRVTKLDDIYCKYLLPYDTLSPEERDKLFNEVEAEWTKRETKVLQRHNGMLAETEEDDEDDSSDEIDECIVKGRNMPLNAFYRIARNTQRMWFGENQRSGNETEGASADEVEHAFWKHVAERKRHVCVHAASIDSSGRGFGFSVAKNSPFARHPWNLKVLTNNAGSVLRALGPIMGVTVPTLHVGMLFSACCWYRDPHGLPWIEYLHTGAKKIWYGIPDEHTNNFKTALSKMVPRYCKNKIIWLPSDTAMVPPDLLVSNGVSLCHTVQEPGQFIIVFPKAFTSSICTGYVVSESVYFAQPSWLETAEQVFKDIQDSCEPSIFSFERLLFNIINDSRSHIDVLKQILPSVTKIREKEISYRKELQAIGLTNTERLPLPDSGKRKKGKKVKEDDGDFECETCRSNLFVSLVNNSQDDSVYCLSHGLQLLTKKKLILKHCTLMYTYDEDELDELIHRLEDRIEAKSKKTNQIKQAK